MKILVKESNGKNIINIKLPMWIIIFFVRCGRLPKNIDINGNDQKELVNIGNEFMRNIEKKNIIKGLKYLQKNHKGLALVDIEDTSGQIVKIEI